MKRVSLLLALLLGMAAQGQTYTIDWYKVSGGGGTSANGQYAVTGTIGQPDASSAMNGGSYSLSGGFWSLISVVQMPGVPAVIIMRTAPNSVTILWPDAATNSYTLEQNSNLANPGGWAASGYTVSSANGTNSVTVMFPAGNVFFRLKQ